MRKSKVKNPSCRPVGPEQDKVLGGHYLYKPTHNVRKYVKKQLLEITFFIYLCVSNNNINNDNNNNALDLYSALH